MASLTGEAHFDHALTEGAAPETLTLRFDVAALLAVEDETGVGLLAIESAMTRLGFLAELLRAALRSGSGQVLTRAEAAHVLMSNDAARGAVRDALNAAFPVAPDSSGNDDEGAAPADPIPAARKNGAGKTS